MHAHDTEPPLSSEEHDLPVVAVVRGCRKLAVMRWKSMEWVLVALVDFMGQSVSHLTLSYSLCLISRD